VEHLDSTPPQSDERSTETQQVPSGLLQPAPTPSFNQRVHGLFVGPEGLRSGWRFVLFVGLWFAALYLLNGLSHLIVAREPRGIWAALSDETRRLLATILATVAMMRLDKRPFGDYGLPLRFAFGKNFWVGAVWGIVSLSVLIFSLDGVGDFTIAGLALHGVRVWKFAAFWGVFFVLVGLFEEFLFRGYSQYTLTRGMGFWPAALLLSLIFGFSHLGNDNESWIGAAAVIVIGLFFCLTLHRTGTLWFAVGFHASWDWGESYLYSIPDSGEVAPGHLLNSSLHGSHWITGGTVGPEGSVFAFAVVALTAVAFSRAYPRVACGATGADSSSLRSPE